jgi:hypothetical protein
LAQSLPQFPQLLASLEVSLQPEEPQFSRLESVHSQEPPWQVWVSSSQVFPQEPQLPRSVWGLTHWPPHMIVPSAQWQAPPSQVAPLGQALPQEPQLAGSVWMLTQLPSEQVAKSPPGGQTQP